MSKTLFDLVHNALRPCLGKALPRDCLSDILLGERNPLARYLIAQGSHVVVALDEYSRNADSSTRGVTPRATPLCLHPRWCTMQVQDLECDIVFEICGMRSSISPWHGKLSPDGRQQGYGRT